MLFAMSAPRGLIDSGLVSGNETQFVFSKEDMLHSDTDDVRRPSVGEFTTPVSKKLLWITHCFSRPFPSLYFHSLNFLDASLTMMEMFILEQLHAAVTPSSGELPTNSVQSSVAFVAVPSVSSDDDSFSSCRGDLDAPLPSLVAGPSKPAPLSEVDVAASTGEGVVPSCTAVVSFADTALDVIPPSHADGTALPPGKKRCKLSWVQWAMKALVMRVVVEASVGASVTERLPYIGTMFDISSERSAQKRGLVPYSLLT